MEVKGEWEVVEGFVWDGVIRSHAIIFAVIEWGDPSAYGKLTRCRFCNKRDLLLSKHTLYVDPVELRNKPVGLVKGSKEDREMGDAWEYATTKRQCEGKGYRGQTAPICTECGVRVMYQYISSGRHSGEKFRTGIPVNGWTALTRRAEPGPDAWWQDTIVTGTHQFNAAKVAQFLANHPYNRRPKTLPDNPTGDVFLNLVGM